MQHINQPQSTHSLAKMEQPQIYDFFFLGENGNRKGVSHHVCAVNWTWVLCKSNKTVLASEHLSSPNDNFIMCHLCLKQYAGKLNLPLKFLNIINKIFNNIILVFLT